MNKFITLLLSATALISAQVCADTMLIKYEFSGVDAAARATPTFEDSTITGGSASWANMDFAGFSGTTETAFVDDSSIGVSLNPNRYLEFTITANSGFLPSDLILSLDFGLDNNEAFDLTAGFSLKTSADIYTDSLLLQPGDVTKFTQLVSPSDTDKDGVANAETVTSSLSGALYENKTSLTFRLYPSISDSSSPQDFIRFDNVTVSAIPEPSTATYMFICALLLPFFRRIRRK